MRKVSVLLAAYCGEKYIYEQVASILPQLHEQDELLIGDDSPAGSATVDMISQFFDDPRVSYCIGPQQGVIRNFEDLLEWADGDIFVLCDQDDVWLPDKLARTRELLNEAKPSLLHHNAIIADEFLRATGQTAAHPGLLRNLLKNSYTGCCMAFTRELLPYIWPFPKGIPMHDQWIGLQAQRHGQVHFLDEPLILWRRHGDTQTGQGSNLKQKICWRLALIKALIGRLG